jgi:2-polyprenyl-3-methyl-5-hydroxy-6-metoxy-1,4-benzoquinol methylase
MIVDSYNTTINNNVRTDTCPCCKSSSIAKVGAIKYAKNTTYSSTKIKLTGIPELFSCDKCKSWFTQNRVPESDSIALYSLGSSWSSDSFTESKTQETVDLIESLVKPGCKMLDIGCANGAMLDYAKQQGAITSGLEYSRANLDELKRKQHNAYSDWSQVQERFDIITAFDVVEHLYDLESFFDSCINHLSDDGLLVFLTGDISSSSANKTENMWWYLRYPEHILFPSLEYFGSIDNFQLVKIVNTHPSKFDTSSSILKIMKGIKARFTSLILGNLFPSPSAPPDHIIVVLKRINNN